jgi:hypothetical protein
MDQYLMNPVFKVKPKTATVDMSKYKERVVHMTSELFDNPSFDAQLQEQFMQYVSECVSYLYRKELTDVCQAEYKISLEPILEEAPEKQVTIFNKMMKKTKIEKKFPIKREINDI